MLLTDSQEEELWWVRVGARTNVYRRLGNSNEWLIFCPCARWHHTYTWPKFAARRLTALEDWKQVATRFAPHKHALLWQYCPDQIKEQLHVSN